MRLSVLSVLAAGAVALPLLALVAGGAHAADAPAFTAAQAQRGVAAYADHCALCHGEAMTGGAGAPALSGPEFAFGWKGRPVSDLYTYVHDMMPPGQAGSLSDQDYLDVVSAILAKNGQAPGDAELKPGAPALATAMLQQP
jgi:mono/diheme cytochrome c family protein